MEARTGIRKATWSNYENAVTQPSIEWLIKISRFFGVSLDDLITGDIPLQDGNTVKQRKHKLYIIDDTSAKLEEQQTELNYIVKELHKLRVDLDAMKQSEKKQ